MNDTDPHAGHGHGNAGHETSDFNWSAMFWVLPLSAILLIAFTLTCVYWFKGAKDREIDLKRSHGADTGELKALRLGEDEILSQYKWIDQGKGLVRIPVARAMELIVKENEGKPGVDYRPVAEVYSLQAPFDPPADAVSDLPYSHRPASVPEPHGK